VIEELLCRQIARLPTIEDRLGDIRREVTEAEEPSEIRPADPFPLGECGSRGRAPSFQAKLSARVHGVNDGFNSPARGVPSSQGECVRARCRALANRVGAPISRLRGRRIEQLMSIVWHEIPIVYVSAPGMLEHWASCEPHRICRGRVWHRSQSVGMTRQLRLGQANHLDSRTL
jgi:hypothetical protein